MSARIVIHRKSPRVIHPEIGKPFRWFIDSRGVRYWIQLGPGGWGHEIFPDHLNGEIIDGFFTLDDIREWAAQ